MWILERTLFNLLQLFFLLGTYVGVKWLNLMVGMCVAFWETTRLFSKVVVPFYISVSGVRGLIVAPHPGQHLILRSVSSLLAILWMWRGFPGGSVVKNLPANAGYTGSWSGKIPCTMGQLGLCTARTEARTQREKPPRWEACALQLESSSHSPQPKKSPHSNEDPVQSNK